MFDIHQIPRDNEYDELDERQVEEYIDGLMTEFAASPEVQPLLQQYGGISWPAMMMEYAFSYLGTPVPKMSVRDFREVVFEIFPRKVSTEPESAQQIVDELRAFWSFVHRQYGLANAKKILDTFQDDTARRLEKELANPANFGMAKSFFMGGMKAGYDMTSQEGLDAFMHAYNSSLPGGPMGGLPLGAGLGGWDFPRLPLGDPLSRKQQEKKRQARKAQRQARKRNRK